MIRFCARLVLAAMVFAGLSVAASAQTKSVTLAVQPSTDIPQMLVAIERNLWRSQGLEVKVITFSSGREALEALLGGSADFAVLTEYPATIAALRGQKFSIIADMSRYKGLRAIASKKWMTLASFKDLAGKKVATTLGTNNEYVTNTMLNEAGVRGEIVNVAPGDTVPALVRGDVQAAVMFPSNYALAQKLLAGDYQEVRTTSYLGHSLLVGTTKVLDTQAAETEAFLKGLLEADKIAGSDPRAAQAAVVTALKGVMTPEVLATMWGDYEYKVILKDDLLDQMSKEAKWIVERGSVKVPAENATVKSLRAFVNEGFLARLSPDSVSLAK